jgi:hypothetical protein
MTRNINYYVEGRLFEWTMTLSTLANGVTFFWWPRGLHESAYHFLLVVMSQAWITAFLVTVGWTRFAGLMLNGQRMFGVKLGPWIRAACAVLSAVIWCQFAIALGFLSAERGFPSPGLFFWTIATFGEFYVAYSAVKNG